MKILSHLLFRSCRPQMRKSRSKLHRWSNRGSSAGCCTTKLHLHTHNLQKRSMFSKWCSQLLISSQYLDLNYVRLFLGYFSMARLLQVTMSRLWPQIVDFTEIRTDNSNEELVHTTANCLTPCLISNFVDLNSYACLRPPPNAVTKYTEKFQRSLQMRRQLCHTWAFKESSGRQKQIHGLIQLSGKKNVFSCSSLLLQQQEKSVPGADAS